MRYFSFLVDFFCFLLKSKIFRFHTNKMAELIAEKLCDWIAIPVVTSPPAEVKSDSSENEAYDAALSFLDSL